MFKINICHTRNSFLAPYIASYSLHILELNRTTYSYVNRTLPKSTVYLSFELEEGVFEVKFKNHTTKIIRSGAYVHTTCGDYIDVYMLETLKQKRRSKIFLVELFPYAFFTLFEAPLIEFINNKSIFLSDLIGVSLVDQLINELSECNDIYQMISSFENVFALYILKKNKILSPLYNWLFSVPYNIPLKTISSTIGYSPKWIELRYKEIYGYSFIRNNKLRRFNFTLQLINQAIIDKKSFLLTDIAYQCKFFDQAHFIKDFKNFSNMTPTEYIQKSLTHSFINLTLHNFDDGKTIYHTFS